MVLTSVGRPVKWATPSARSQVRSVILVGLLGSPSGSIVVVAGNEIPKIDMATLEAAMEIVHRQNEVFEGVRSLFEGGKLAYGMGKRMAAQQKFALKAIEVNTEEAGYPASCYRRAQPSCRARCYGDGKGNLHPARLRALS